MSYFLNAFDHKRWANEKLEDFGDFADQIGECNQIELGDCTAGEWFHFPDAALPKSEEDDGERWAIYYGTWGNDNSPGASSYTNATIYLFPEDKEEYEKDKAEWEAKPEWAPQDMECLDCGEEYEKSDMEFDDHRDGYVCESCQNKEPEEEDDEAVAD